MASKININIYELTVFCMMNRKDFPSNTDNKDYYLQQEVQCVHFEESCFSFYLLEEHDEVGQELCEFFLIRRLSQVIKDHVYDDLFVWKIRMSQHQQLCTLLWSQLL